jgi:hypothetical protein
VRWAIEEDTIVGASAAGITLTIVAAVGAVVGPVTRSAWEPESPTRRS